MKNSKTWALCIGVVVGAGCGSEDPEATQAAPGDAIAEATAQPQEELLVACTLKMTAPEQHEWTTYWDPRGIRNAGEGPSNAHSIYWADASEQEALARSNAAEPIDVTCSSRAESGSSSPEIGVSIASFALSAQEVPFAPGSYPIVSRGQGGGMQVPIATLGERMFDVSGGTFVIDRFDAEGVAGSFKMQGREAFGDAPFELQGTFDIPCRGGMLEGACRSNKAVR